jgi:acyl carrier protein
MQESAHQRLLALVRRILDSPDAPHPLTTEMRLADLNFGSLKMVGLMLGIESEFAVAIPPHEITPQNFESIGSVDGLLTRLLGAGG